MTSVTDFLNSPCIYSVGVFTGKPNCKPLERNYRLLNVYCEILGTSLYGEGRTSLRVRLRHMNECRIFHNIHSVTFFIIYL